MRFSTLVFILCFCCLLKVPDLKAQTVVSFNISVPAGPVPTFAFNAGGNTFTFINSSTGTGVVLSSWDFGDGGTSTAQNPTHTYAVDGTYNVCLTVTDGNNCTATSCQTLTAVANTNPIPGLKLDVAPNPFAGEATFQYELSSTMAVNCNLYDLLGNKVQTITEGEQTPGSYRYKIGANVAVGTYFLVFEADGKLISRRIVKAQ
jgi:PKD repeat protein